ncbi:hypothetical protein TrST_g9040 [Triparma strigata]|uniref:Uncharacterized protein n=1 Tax=Triparma strigata TaxID=1606541 RepID=A0A9W6ZKZ5_9STRA|nr:hypothetical protein TrST_g9040 [Triparma strigata]
MKRPVRPSLTGRNNAKLVSCKLNVDIKSVSIQYNQYNDNAAGSNPGLLDELSTLSIMVKRGGKSTFVKPDNIKVAPGVNSSWTGNRCLDLDITLYGLGEGFYEEKNYDLVVGKSVNERNGGFNELATFSFDASKFSGEVEKRVELCQSRSMGRNGFLEVRAVAVIDCVTGKVDEQESSKLHEEDGDREAPKDGGEDHIDDGSDENDDVLSVASTTNINVGALYNLREELSSVREELEKEKQSKEELLAAIQKEHETYRIEKDQEIGSVRKDSMDLRKKLDKIEMAAELAAKKRSDLEDKMVVESKRNRTLSTHNEGLKSTKMTLKEEKSKLEEEVRKLKESNAEAVATFEREKAALEKKLSEAGEALEQQQREAEDTEVKGRRQVIQLQQEKDSKVEAAIKEGEEKLEKQKKEAEEAYKKELEKQKEENADKLLDEITSLGTKHQEALTAVETHLENQLKQLQEKSDAELQAKIEEVEALMLKVTSKDKALEELKSLTEKEVEAQQADFDESRKALENDLIEKSREFEDTIEQLEHRIIDAKVEIAELKMTITSQKSDTSMTLTPKKGAERRSTGVA